MRKDILPEDETRFYIAETVLGIEAIHKHRCGHVCTLRPQLCSTYDGCALRVMIILNVFNEPP